MIDTELEGQVLATMINDADSLTDGLADLAPGDFTDGFYRHMFGALGKMYEANMPISTSTVYEHCKNALKNRGISWAILKDAYLMPGTFGVYVNKLKSLTKARRLMKIAQDIVGGVKGKEDIEELCVRVEDALYSIMHEAKTEIIVSPKERAARILETITARMDEKNRKAVSVFTSFKRLNYLTGGFEAGDLVIISGPTGGGKTTLAQNFMRDISIVQKLPGLHINTEMSETQIDIRWAAMLAKDTGVTNTTLRAGTITQDQLSTIVSDGLNAIDQSEMYSITIPDLTVAKLLSTIRRVVAQKKIRVLVVDYIGRVDTMNSNKDDWKQLLSAAKKLKTISQQYGLVTFMICQNNADGNLAMAGYMEHEADLHLHIRPMTDKETEEYHYRKFETWWNYMLVIKKGRSSATGCIPVRFAGERLTFYMDEQEARYHAKLVEEQQKQKQNTADTENQGKGSYSGGQRYQQRSKPYQD